MFGPHWWSGLAHIKLGLLGCISDPDFGCVPATVQVWNPDGSSDVYRHVAGSNNPYRYSAFGSASGGTMTYYPNVQWVLDRERHTLTYSAAGHLRNMSGPMGLSLSFAYAASPPGQLLSVTHNVGQQVRFTWSGARVVAVAGPSGGVWTYAYNANGMLASVTSSGSNPDVRQYHYESAVSPTLLTGISINGVRHSTYGYRSDRKTQESGLVGGEERDTFQYGTNSTTVTNAAGLATTYNFVATSSGALRPTTVSRAAMTTCPATDAQTVYDANGYVDYTLDWNGNRTDYCYDSSGRIVQVTTASGTTAALTKINVWDSGINLLESQFRDAAGAGYLKVAYTYFTSGLPKGRVATETWTDLRSGATRQTRYGYAFHPNNALASQSITRVLPAGDATTTMTYDTLGNLVSMTNALGQQASWSSYNGFGQPGRMTDQNGVVSDYAYDPKGNVVTLKQQLPGGARSTSFFYNHDRQVTDIVHANGRVQRFRYNAAGRLDHVGNAADEFVQLPFDIPGNTASTRSNRHVPTSSGQTPVPNAGGEFVSTAQLDGLRRPWNELGNNGQWVSYAYDGNGNTLSRTDAASRVTRYDYDAQNRPVKLTAADSGVTTYTYNVEGRLESVRDPRGLRTSYTYDGFGQRTRQTSGLRHDDVSIRLRRPVSPPRPERTASPSRTPGTRSTAWHRAPRPASPRASSTTRARTAEAGSRASTTRPGRPRSSTVPPAS